MPTIQLRYSQDERGPNPPALVYIQALMCFPKNEQKRLQFINSQWAFALGQCLAEPGLEGTQIDALHVRYAMEALVSFPALFEEAARPVASSARKLGERRSVHSGFVAAHVILIPLVVNFRRGKMVGRSAAYRVLVEHLLHRNKLHGAQERSLQQIWKRYQSVAHLWAAFHLWDGFPKDEEEAIEFLSLAEHVRGLAEGYRPSQSREPLLDERCTWKVPEGFPLLKFNLDLELIEMPEEWINLAIGSGPN